MPLISDAYTSGMRRRDFWIPVRLLKASTAGMRMATTAVPFITPPKKQVATMMTTIMRGSLRPAARAMALLIAWPTPVRVRAAPITSRPAIWMTTGLPKPESDSRGVRTPVSIRASTVSKATASGRMRVKDRSPPR